MRIPFRAIALSVVAAALLPSWDVPPAKWIENGIIDAGGTHEPYSFLVRRGGQRLDARAQSERAESEATLRRLRDQGVEVFHTHLYKGFGMAAEMPEMEQTRRTAARAHSLGLKVDTYVQWNTLMYETFFAEQPAARDWVQRDADGKPILLTYGYGQSYRYRPCFANPDYLAYLKRVVRYAVAEVHSDFLHFDNFDLNPEPESCHCPHCLRAFHRHLETKYPTVEARRERFALDNLQFVQPPVWNRDNPPEKISAIRDPIIQEWIDFRCQMMSDALGEIAAYAKSLNREVVIEVNPHGITGGNRTLEAGLDHARFLKHTQVFWTEEGTMAGLQPDGRLLSKIRSYKLARTYHNILFTYINGSPLAMAESLAFNQTIGFAGADPISPTMRRYIDFYRHNRALFNATRDVAPVAVLRSYASLTYNSPKTQLSAILAEQALIEARVPFAIIFDEHLADLSRFRALVLPDAECLSDAQLASIRAFVERGGGLVALGDSGAYDQWRRQRPQPGLSALLRCPSRSAQRATFGQGRAAYLPKLEFDGELPEPGSFGAIRDKFWKRPANATALVDALRWTSRDRLALDLAPPGALVANLMEQPGRRLLHLVNYGPAKPTPAAQARLEIPEQQTVSGVNWLSPDGSTRPLPFQAAAGSVRFQVPPIPVYAMVVVEYAARP
jgi:hypothetical protein